MYLLLAVAHDQRNLAVIAVRSESSVQCLQHGRDTCAASDHSDVLASKGVLELNVERYVLEDHAVAQTHSCQVAR